MIKGIQYPDLPPYPSQGPNPVDDKPEALPVPSPFNPDVCFVDKAGTSYSMKELKKSKVFTHLDTSNCLKKIDKRIDILNAIKWTLITLLVVSYIGVPITGVLLAKSAFLGALNETGLWLVPITLGGPLYLGGGTACVFSLASNLKKSREKLANFLNTEHFDVIDFKAYESKILSLKEFWGGEKSVDEINLFESQIINLHELQKKRLEQEELLQKKKLELQELQQNNNNQISDIIEENISQKQQEMEQLRRDIESLSTEIVNKFEDIKNQNVPLKESEMISEEDLSPLLATDSNQTETVQIPTLLSDFPTTHRA